MSDKLYSSLPDTNIKIYCCPVKKIEDFSSVVLVGTLRAASDSISGIADLEADAARSVPTDRNKKYLRHLRMKNLW